MLTTKTFVVYSEQELDKLVRKMENDRWKCMCKIILKVPHFIAELKFCKDYKFLNFTVN